MMTKRYAAALASAALLALPVATPAFAQGSLSPFPKGDGACPGDWSMSGGMCRPGSSNRKAYRNPSRARCPSGYTSQSVYCIERTDNDGVSAADRLVSNATLVKANRLDRCPLGYFSKADMATCTTQLSPAPQSRRKAGACRAGEIDEWGLYCTANANAITRQQAEKEADRDFNAIYTANGGTGPTQTPGGDDTTNSAPMVAAYGRKGGGGGAASSSSSNSGNTASAPAANANCTTDTSSAGAALGGALGGQMGAALGGMMGGMAKKKPGC